MEGWIDSSPKEDWGWLCHDEGHGSFCFRGSVVDSEPFCQDTTCDFFAHDTTHQDINSYNFGGRFNSFAEKRMNANEPFEVMCFPNMEKACFSEHGPRPDA